ncbi:MAG: hypothetical protein ACRCUT_12045, partial [Spirochaetota bacterium]
RNAVSKAACQARYAFVSNEELKKRLGASIAVSDSEIDEEMTKNKGDIKDPATDRERFKNRLIDRKIETAKASLVKSVDGIAMKEESFEKAASLLGGKTAATAVFKPGDPVKEAGKEGKVLYSLSESDIFLNGFSMLKPGVSSKAISARDGVWVFTPSQRTIAFEAPKEADAEKMAEQMRQEREYTVESAVYRPYFEKAKIVRNLKEEQSENN